jgi:hypothetical protein
VGFKEGCFREEVGLERTLIENFVEVGDFSFDSGLFEMGFRF